MEVLDSEEGKFFATDVLDTDRQPGLRPSGTSEPNKPLPFDRSLLSQFNHSTNSTSVPPNNSPHDVPSSSQIIFTEDSWPFTDELWPRVKSMSIGNTDVGGEKQVDQEDEHEEDSDAIIRFGYKISMNSLPSDNIFTKELWPDSNSSGVLPDTNQDTEIPLFLSNDADENDYLSLGDCFPKQYSHDLLVDERPVEPPEPSFTPHKPWTVVSSGNKQNKARSKCLVCGKPSDLKCKITKPGKKSKRPANDYFSIPARLTTYTDTVWVCLCKDCHTKVDDGLSEENG
ncbi:hypothetical protein D9758_000431 [Tetrapyrgos nigripes]|uniref:Uncharacterized protein n=1 Tax=Tetrapyrgos nigripes TaxID=182062 RepID=A0A8H5LYU2_9AGAR|nr:hypothetical protein D9758_000431 [Tetrapyrgos nigripes]